MIKNDQGWIIRNVILIIIAGFIKGSIHGFLNWFLPMYFLQLKGILLFVSSYSISLLLRSFSALLGGRLADKSRKWTLFLSDSLFFISVALLFLYVSSSPLELEWILVLSLILYYISEAMPTSPSFLMRVESLPTNFQGKFISLGLPLSAVSHATGSLFFGYYYALSGVEVALNFCLLFLLILLASRLFLIETKKSTLKYTPNYIKGLKYIFKDRVYSKLLALSLLLGIASTSSLFLPGFLNEICNIPKMTIATLFASLQLARLISAILLGHIIDIKRVKYTYLDIAGASLIINAFSLAAFIILSPKNQLFIWLLMIPQVLIPLYRPAVNIFIASYYTEYKGIAIAGLHALKDLMGLALPLVGFVWTISPILSLLIFLSFTRFCGGLLLLAARRSLRHEEK